MNGWIYYATTLLVYAGVDILACLGLSMQFGISGVVNFGFILYQAAGAYVAAVLSLPASTENGGFQHYIGGLNLPFPIPWIVAAIVGGLLAIPMGAVVGRKLRPDYAAIAMLVVAIMANTVITNFQPIFNGAAGVALVPPPLSDTFDPNTESYQWVYGIAAVIVAVLIYFVVRRITESPYGRSLRAMRDNGDAAAAVGKHVRSMRTAMLVLGGSIAALSGAILVGFITLWAPGAWTYPETIVLFAAIIVGGLGNHRGAILGALLVPLAFEEATRFIPAFGPPGLVPATEWVVIGVLILAFLWFRPQGVLPERKRKAKAARTAILQTADTGVIAP